MHHKPDIRKAFDFFVLFLSLQVGCFHTPDRREMFPFVREHLLRMAGSELQLTTAGSACESSAEGCSTSNVSVVGSGWEVSIVELSSSGTASERFSGIEWTIIVRNIVESRCS